MNSERKGAMGECEGTKTDFHFNPFCVYLLFFCRLVASSVVAHNQFTFSLLLFLLCSVLLCAPDFSRDDHLVYLVLTFNLFFNIDPLWPSSAAFPCSPLGPNNFYCAANK